MSDEPLQIDCEIHGRGVAAAVCGHLINNKVPLGFIENCSNPNDLQGWCYACEFLFLQESDKTEKFQSFCHHSMVCCKCYVQIKGDHSIEL